MQLTGLSPTLALPAPPRIPRSCVVLFRAGGAGLECSGPARRPQGTVAQRASAGCGCDTEPTCRSLSAPHVADPRVLSPLLISLKTEARLGCYSGVGGLRFLVRSASTGDQRGFQPTCLVGAVPARPDQEECRGKVSKYSGVVFSFIFLRFKKQNIYLGRLK